MPGVAQETQRRPPVFGFVDRGYVDFRAHYQAVVVHLEVANFSGPNSLTAGDCVARLGAGLSLSDKAAAPAVACRSLETA